MLLDHVSRDDILVILLCSLYLEAFSPCYWIFENRREIEIVMYGWFDCLLILEVQKTRVEVLLLFRDELLGEELPFGLGGCRWVWLDEFSLLLFFVHVAEGRTHLHAAIDRSDVELAIVNLGDTVLCLRYNIGGCKLMLCNFVVQSCRIESSTALFKSVLKWKSGELRKLKTFELCFWDLPLVSIGSVSWSQGVGKQNDLLAIHFR